MAYFDNAATTYPKPECVYQYMDKFYRECGGNAGRGNYEQAKSAGELIANTRSMIQDLLHCPTKQVVFEPTATIALNLIIQGNIERGAHNIYVSPFEHNAVTRVLHFKYPEAVRRLIYTTNTIEGFNRQLRKVTKSKTVFPSDDSLLKMLYLAMIDITKKWTGHRQDWGQIHSQLEIFFEERLERL